MFISSMACVAWQSVVKIAAVDCSDMKNDALCKEHRVSSYPSLIWNVHGRWEAHFTVDWSEIVGGYNTPDTVWFPVHSTGATSGVEFLRGNTADEARQDIVEFISRHLYSVRATNASQHDHHPLAPISKLRDIWKHGTDLTQYYIVVVESSASFIGSEVILDLISYKQLTIRRLIDDKFGQPGIGLVSRVDDSPQLKPLFVRRASRERFVSVLMRLLNGSMSSLRPVSTSAPSTLSAALPASSAPRGFIDKLRLKDDSTPRDVHLHEQDLESNLHYSLRHEVAMFASIGGHRLIALKQYVQALAKFLPVRKPLHRFLLSLHEWLEEQETMMASLWLSEIEDLQTKSSYLPSVLHWTGCRGSALKYRGYPCSLWMTFHTLVISAANKRDTSMNAVSTLLAVRGYIKYFFGCEECRKHFLRGTRNLDDVVVTDRDAVLYLWRSHNTANYFLHGDVTEDPQHPKVQFPDPTQCPACHKTALNGSAIWNEDSVFQFLLRMYSGPGLVHDSESVGMRPAMESGNSDPQMDGGGGHGVDFALVPSVVNATRLDVSLCLAFYILCTGLMGLLYYRFCRPFRSRKNSSYLPV